MSCEYRALLAGNRQEENYILSLGTRVRLRGVRHRHLFVGFSIEDVLSLLPTCVGCVEMEDGSFTPFGTMEDIVCRARASP